jgi:two-component system LytT family response regulator
MRVLIADDEAPARAKIRRILESEADVEIVAEAATGREAVDVIHARAPDLVLLDIQMPELDGFGVVEEVGVEKMPHVVFVTAFDEHALRAFEVHALDYLTKPFPPERLRSAVARVRAQLGTGGSQPPPPDTIARLAALLESLGTAPKYLRRVLVHHEERAFFLPVERIDRVEADRNYVRLHVAERSFQLRSTIVAFGDRLDPAKFLRINRSEIVRLDAIQEMQPWFHGDYRVVMQDGRVLTWSRRYRARTATELGGLA